MPFGGSPDAVGLGEEAGDEGCEENDGGDVVHEVEKDAVEKELWLPTHDAEDNDFFWMLLMPKHHQDKTLDNN